jgi:hypothetical protein
MGERGEEDEMRVEVKERGREKNAHSNVSDDFPSPPKRSNFHLSIIALADYFQIALLSRNAIAVVAEIFSMGDCGSPLLPPPHDPPRSCSMKLFRPIARLRPGRCISTHRNQNLSMDQTGGLCQVV